MADVVTQTGRNKKFAAQQTGRNKKFATQQHKPPEIKNLPRSIAFAGATPLGRRRGVIIERDSIEGDYIACDHIA